MHFPKRDPLATCPYCSWKVFSVIGHWAKASHLWKQHGVASSLTLNRKTKTYGSSQEN